MPQLPLQLLLLLAPLGPLSPRALPRASRALDGLRFLTTQPLHLLSPAFLSFTIDANLATDPRFLTFLGSPKLRTLARGLLCCLGFQSSLCANRFSNWSLPLADICKSGSIPPHVHKKLELEWLFQEQWLLREQYQKNFKNTTYSRSSVDMLYTFANCSGLDLIFGLNALLRTADLQWNSSNAQLLLDYCSSKNYNISWELGNEPNSFQKKAGIFIDGLQLGEDFIELHKLLRKSTYKHAKLYGPDVGQPRGKTVKMLKSFLEAGGDVIDSVTWHQLRQEDRLSPGVAVSEDYWLSLLFKKLVGTRVLMASVKGGAGRKLRVYLHCTNINQRQYKEGDLTLYAINLHNVTKHLQLPYYLFNKQVDKYVVKPSGPDGLLSKSVQLNGQTLRMVDDQTLPTLTEKSLRPGSSLGLPAFSYGFFVIRNAKVAACT
uniref:Heparanase n=1 Tax=Microcebus murinus TaxID=30608 RepID=A0A8C5XLE0_MICMU